MRRPILSNQSQMLLTVVLVVCLVASYFVATLVTGGIALALAVLLLVAKTPPSDGASR